MACTAYHTRLLNPLQYFALTTDESDASFGVNCDVPNLHFDDTCVTDDDCEAFPNTVCSNAPLNKGLDPGTRDVIQCTKYLITYIFS